MFQFDINGLRALAVTVLPRHLSIDALQWFTQLQTQDSLSLFNSCFVQIPRRTGKALIQLSGEEKLAIAEAGNGASWEHWTVDRLARVVLLFQSHLSTPANINQLLLSADVNEQVAIYSALPFFENGPEWAARCSEGIRSNIGDVLEAIMCYNPYAAGFLEEAAWNQLVLKAFFTEKPVEQLIGLDERRNAALADTLFDYIHERWSAGRSVHPYIWKCVTPFLNEARLEDVKKLALQGSDTDREVAALVCYHANFAPALSLVQTNTTLQQSIETNTINWNSVLEKFTQHVL